MSNSIEKYSQPTRKIVGNFQVWPTDNTNKKTCPPNRMPGKTARVFTWEELEKDHADRSKTLLVIQGKVYDVTKWKTLHPGGAMVLEVLNGKDATDPFLAYHEPAIAKKLSAFYIGEVRVFLFSSSCSFSSFSSFSLIFFCFSRYLLLLTAG